MRMDAMSTDAEGKYVDKGRRKDKDRPASGAALWLLGLVAFTLGMAGLVFVQNIFLGLMLVVVALTGSAFIAAGCTVSAVRDRTHGHGRDQ